MVLVITAVRFKSLVKLLGKSVAFPQCNVVGVRPTRGPACLH